MKYLSILILLLSFLACRKTNYRSYIGTYSCQVEYHDDSTHSAYKKDTTYTEMAEIIELDGKNMQFRDLPIPYEYIQKNGDYITGHFVPGVYWGREITLRNDSLYYFHYEGTAERYWSIRYAGKLLQ